MGTQLPSPIKGAEPPPQFPAHFCCGQMAGCTKMPLGMEVGLSPGDFVLDVPKKWAEPPPPNFWPMFIVAKRLDGSIKMALSSEIGFSPGNIVLDGDPAPSPKRGQSPQFSAHVCCSQTAAWIKMPLGMEVGLCPGDIVLDGDSAFLP